MRFRLLAAYFLLSALPAVSQQAGPPSKEPLRNTFVIAAESVLDQAASLDVNAEAAAFDSGMVTLKTAQANLQGLAANEREIAVSDEMKSMMFAITSCRIQAVDGTDIAPCLQRIASSRNRLMALIHKHKQSDRWVDGDPQR